MVVWQVQSKDCPARLHAEFSAVQHIADSAPYPALRVVLRFGIPLAQFQRVAHLEVSVIASCLEGFTAVSDGIEVFRPRF